MNQHPKVITLNSAVLSISLDISDSGVFLKSLKNATGWEWLTSPDSSAYLWRLVLRDPEGAGISVTSADAVFVSSENSAQHIALAWNAPLGASSTQVRMSIKCESGSDMSYWSLEVDLPDGWKVIQADYPVIPSIKLHKDLKMAAPVGWGLEFNVKPGMQHNATYPSFNAAMQFLAFYAKDHGLYIGTHDPNANYKKYSVSADDGVSYTCANYPGIPETGGGTYRIPFETAIGVFQGDYWNAARIYRDFALTTKWGSAGPVSQRPIPQWLKDTDLWLRPDGSPENNAEVTKQALKYFDVPTSLHWYRWHEIPYDTLYPEYFPPLPGFAEGIAEFQRLGAHVVPYINGRICDPNSRTWNEEQGSKSAARQENGEPYTELYGSQVPLNVMCPSTKQWQGKIAGLVGRLVKECGVNGIYIDQIACAQAVLCFDKDHNHLPGGGDMWVKGYREMLDQVRLQLPEDGIITTEENAECWIDQFDILLLVNTQISPKKDQSIIPLFPSVFAGYALAYGFLYFAADDLQRSLPFRQKMAQALVFGSQLGWIQPWRIMPEEFSVEAEFLRNLARCRHYGHDFLTYGDFLGLLSVHGDNPRLRGTGSGFFEGTYQIDTPAILASAWSLPDGRLGVVLANMSDHEHEFTVTLPLRRAGIKSYKGLTVDAYGPNGPFSTVRLAGSDCVVAVPARGAAFIIVHK